MSKMTFEDYTKAVRKAFMGCGYSTDEMVKYFNTDSVKAHIKDDYDGYVKGVSASHSPQAVASCLDMMY